MNWLVMSWFLTLGIVPQQTECCNGQYCSPVLPSTVAEIGLSATAFDHLILSTSMENYQTKGDNLTFNPYRIDYKFSAGVRINDNVSVWFDHECDHPVLSGNIVKYDYRSEMSKLYIKLEGSTK
jgi:hypothetical protein